MDRRNGDFNYNKVIYEFIKKHQHIDRVAKMYK